MVVAHQRHKSTGDMFVLALDDHLRTNGRLIGRNSNENINSHDEDEDDDDQERQKRAPLLDASASHAELVDGARADRWTSCKVLAECRVDEDNDDASFLRGKQKVSAGNQDEKLKQYRGRRHEFKSAGNLSLLFSLFQPRQQPPDSKRQDECQHDGAEKTRASADGRDKTSGSADRPDGDEREPTEPTQTQRARRADGNLASAASSPHLFGAARERTNSICADDATGAAGPAATCTSGRRESWSRAGGARRRRQLAAAASHGQPVMKLPRVERRTKPERARRVTTSRDNNNVPQQQQHSSCFSLDGEGNCSAWLGAPSSAPASSSSSSARCTGSESGLESQPLAAWPARVAHKSQATNGAGVGETRTAQVSGGFDSAQCVAQPAAGRLGEHQPGSGVMRAAERPDNASLLSFQGATVLAEQQLHNRRQQQLAATLGRHPPAAAAAAYAGGQDVRRCAMAGSESSPTLRPPLACQLAPQSQSRASRDSGPVPDCPPIAADQFATRAILPEAPGARNARTSGCCSQMDSDRNVDAKDGADHEPDDEYANRVAQESSGQDQVCRAQAKNVNNSKSSQERQQTSGRQHSSAPSSVASKLVDTCASSWRLALMATSGVTSSAGSYKVAQAGGRARAFEQPQQQQQQRRRRLHHQVAPDQALLQRQQRADSGRPRNASSNANNDSRNGHSRPDRYYRVAAPSACEEVAIGIEQELQLQQLDNFNRDHDPADTLGDPTTSGRSQSQPAAAQEAARGGQHGDTCRPHKAPASSPSHNRHHTDRLARPSRSPVSLQRQTNARLARHRLKIQQQRQEQLTRLALREREFLTSTRGAHQSTATCSPSVSTPTSQPRRADTSEGELEIEILEQDNHGQDNRLQPAGQSSSLLRGLLEKFSLTAPRTSGGLQVPPVALVNFGAPASTRSRYQRRQSRQQQQVSTAIDICDNYRSATAPDGRRQIADSSPLANVITFSASTGVSSEHKPPERRRELSDMQQQLSSGGGGGGDGRVHPAACDKTKTKSPETGSQCSSTSSSTLSLNKPFCKICHLSSTGNESDKLISPCKCSGTMQYIHCGCLLKWLEISNRTNEGAISCELCAHEYTWHKRFNYKQMKLPKCSSKDVLLHLIFLAALGLMLFCALAPIFTRCVRPASGDLLAPVAIDQEARPKLRGSFRSHFNEGFQTTSSSGGSNGAAAAINRPAQNGSAGKLASDEKFILLCAAFFFISFFVAVYLQMKTRDTLYGLIVKFANMNLTYYITEYDHGGTANHNASDSQTDGPTSDSKGAARQDRYHQHQHQGDNEQRQATQVRNSAGDTRRKGSA